jgi:hypothetical protein
MSQTQNTSFLSTVSSRTGFPVQCQHCNVILGSAEIQNFHVQVEHHFRCNKCHKICTTKTGLQQHQKVHQALPKSVGITYDGMYYFFQAKYFYTQQSTGKTIKVNRHADGQFHCPCGSYTSATPADLEGHAEQHRRKTKKKKGHRSARGQFEHATPAVNVQLPGSSHSGSTLDQDSADVHSASVHADCNTPTSQVLPPLHRSPMDQRPRFRPFMGTQAATPVARAVSQDHPDLTSSPAQQLLTSQQIVSVQQAQTLENSMDVDDEHELMIEPLEMNPSDSLLEKYDLKVDMILCIVFCLKCGVAVLPDCARGHAATHFRFVPAKSKFQEVFKHYGIDGKPQIPLGPIAPIPGLQLISGFKCQPCGYLTSSFRMISEHCRKCSSGQVKAEVLEVQLHRLYKFKSQTYLIHADPALSEIPATSPYEAYIAQLQTRPVVAPEAAEYQAPQEARKLNVFLYSTQWHRAINNCDCTAIKKLVAQPSNGNDCYVILRGAVKKYISFASEIIPELSTLFRQYINSPTA